MITTLLRPWPPAFAASASVPKLPRASIRASMHGGRTDPLPNVTLRVDFSPEVGAMFTENVAEISGALGRLRDKGPAVAGAVLAEMLWDAAQQANGTESEKLEAFVKAVNSRRFDSVLVTGLPTLEAEADGKIYYMRRAALLGLAVQAGFEPRADLRQGGEGPPRFDQWTAPVFPALKQLKPLPEKPSKMLAQGRQPTYTDVLQENVPKTEGADELLAPPVVALAGVLPTGVDVRLVPFSDVVKALEPCEKPGLFLPQFVMKRQDVQGEETGMALPLAMPAQMRAKEFLTMVALRRKNAKDDGWAAVMAGGLNMAKLRLDARSGMMTGLTPEAERILEKLRHAAVVQGEKAPPVPLKEGEVLFVNNHRQMHRTGGESSPRYTVLAEKMRLETTRSRFR